MLVSEGHRKRFGRSGQGFQLVYLVSITSQTQYKQNNDDWKSGYVSTNHNVTIM